MRREEYIYVQTGVCVRNRDQINVNTSSDFCFSDDTSFVVSGATKVVTDVKVCDFSGISYTNIYTAATECFTTQSLTDECFETVEWYIVINENDVEVSRELFYTSEISGATPTEAVFLAGITSSFLQNQYSFTQSGTTFTVTKPFGVTDLRVDICTEVNLHKDCMTTDLDECGCPDGYDVTPDNTQCTKTTTTGATLNGSLITVIAGDTSASYGSGGALFYNDITNEPFPISDISAASPQIQNASGDTLPIQQQVKNNLWGLGTVPTGRLNNIGVWGSGVGTNEWIGFSKCIEINESKTYSIGIAADDKMRFRLNGEEILNFVINGNGYSHQYWRVLEITLNAGKNIIEMEGLNEGSAKSFGAEIYDSTIDVLSGYTSEAQLSAVTIFTTGDLIGGEFDLGETGGYSCPTGYSLDNCVSGTPVCTLIEFASGNTCEYTGTCESDCYTACTETFDSIQSGDTGVYIVEDETTLDFTFDLTGNTTTLNSSHNFKYEVYKYNNFSKIWNVPAVYKSPEIPYSSISGATGNDFIQQIPVNSLQLDGDYLIKGFFKYDACTEFANRLGISVDTSLYSNGQYVDSLDWYFIAIREAETPELTISGQVTPEFTNLFSYSLFNTFDGQTDYVMTTIPDGEPIVALNGLTLGYGLDYAVISGNTIQLSGETFSGDVITVIGAKGDGANDPIQVDTFLVDTAVVSGTTDGQGSENVYYNTDTSKYEIYSSVNIATSDVVVTINGITLANNIDYYTSVSNPRRVILEGDVLEDDVINIYYTPSTDANGQLTVNPFTISWSIENAPVNNDGKFVIEVTNSADTGFDSIQQSIEVPYQAGLAAYSGQVTLSGSVGDEYIYRVKNSKEYVSLNGDIIVSENYSEVVSIFIASNNINTY